jgi:hypothetical protein
MQNGSPLGEPCVCLPGSLLWSDAWRSLDSHAHRFVQFLLREHVRHSGRKNGQLKAPWRQLHAVGIWHRYIGPAVTRAEDLGLVACTGAGMRAVAIYRLTWLESHDGQPATDEWLEYCNPELPPLPPKIRNLLVKWQADRRPNLLVNRQSPNTKEEKHLSRERAGAQTEARAGARAPALLFPGQGQGGRRSGRPVPAQHLNGGHR